MVVGGGPAGLKAAAVAAERGHEVHLHEREAQTGGQAKLAQLLPKRAEFGGIITNLTREAERHGAIIHRRSEVTRELLMREKPDAVILATGSTPAHAADRRRSGADRPCRRYSGGPRHDRRPRRRL